MHFKSNTIIGVFTTVAVVVFFVFNVYFLFQLATVSSSNYNATILQIAISSLFCFLSITTLIQYYFFKDLTYILYTLYLQINLCYFVVIFSSNPGITEQLSNEFKNIRYYLSLPLLMLSYFIYTHFATHFLNLKDKDKFSYKWITILSKVYLVLLILTVLSYLFLVDTKLGLIIRSIFLILCMPLGIVSIIIVYVKVRNIITHILCIGSLLFFTGSVLGFLYSSKTIAYPIDRFPFNQWVFYTELGTILEIIMFFSSFALRNKVLADEERAAQQKLQLIRDEIAKDLHDDIGATLSNINILNELAKRNANNPLKANEYLNKATEDIQNVSESLSDIVWNINPKYDDLNNLFIRMKRYAADMLDGKNIQHDIDFPIALNDIRLGMDKRKDLYFIYKEAINNLVKYSNAKYASIVLTIHNNKLQLDIKDNGVGFERNTVVEGNGLQNMQQRSQNIHADFIIQSVKGTGTSISLTMQL
jgi:signal transduction histidine kinase